MADIGFHKELEKLIAYAKTLGERKNGPLTAERFLVAVLDAVVGMVSVDWDQTMEASQLLGDYNFDMDKGRQSLLNYINTQTGKAFLDDLYMKKKLAAAGAQAQASGQPHLTAGLLLKCILEDPSDAIKSCITAADSTVSDADADARRAELSKLIDSMVGDTEDLIPTVTAGIEDQSTKRTVQTAGEESGPKKIGNSKQAKTKVAKLTERVKQIQTALSDIVFGQDHAVDVFASGYFQAEMLSMTDKKRVRPRATYLFAGPPGVGKTFLAESAAKVLNLPFQRFDMSEYCDNEAAVEFCGSDKVYKNAKQGNFTSFVSEHPKSVVLFDEIEKAHISVIHLFLQILDAGRIRDNYTDKDIPLKDVIMIFTTNAGKQLYAQSDSGDFSNVSRKVILKALQKDINPTTGQPYFPGAICSRFASGNVVMFNHITAHNLCGIARREVLRHARNFREEIGVEVEIDERVYSALLFAEGGAADARTVRSRAESFFDDELFELFRLTGSVEGIESIRMGVDLPDGNSEVAELFESKEKPEVLLFTAADTARICEGKGANCTLKTAETAEEAAKILRTSDIKLVLLDLTCGMQGERQYLNIEDVPSAARDFFRHVRMMYADLPVYLLQTPDHIVGAEERVSFMRQGVRGVLTVSAQNDTFAADLNKICENLHQQHSMEVLARANKVVSFETAQILSPDGKSANIRLFDFTMAVALDPDDAEGMLSSVSKPNVRFDQVIGAEDAKGELKYFVEYLKNPKKYLGTGVRAPRGVLLYGPPGTGKTMLAKAMASESDVTFITAEGNQFLKRYVGEGPEKVHELFRTARKYAPAILFVDEIDAIAKERRGEDGQGVEETLTAFLAEMDGFKNDTSKPVFVLAATNFDVEPGRPKSLDPALMRRFDRRVYIDLPNREDRVRYINMKISGNPAFQVSQTQLDNLALRSTGMSLASLESVFELALRSAIRTGGAKVTDEVLDEAFETFNSGEKKQWDASTLERVARHEAGHAYLCWYGGETPSYLTIVARGSHGGYMQHGDHEGKAIYTREELLSRIRTSLGGRAAEIVYYGPEDGISTGASGDLSNATATAQRIICSYGMDENFGLAVVDQQAARVGELSSEVRIAVNQILSREMENAVRILKENREAVDRLVNALIAKNQLTQNEIIAVLGESRS